MSMDRKYNKFALICSGLLYFAYLSSGIIVSESEQITLEKSKEILASPIKCKKVLDDLQEIRRFCTVVAKVCHDAKWTAGQLIMPWIELNKDFGKNISGINESEYGPIVSTSPNSIFPDALFQFSKPYNPEVLGKIIENMFGYKNSPNMSRNEIRNEITYFDLEPIESQTRIYYFKKAWKSNTNNGRICTHFWEFKIAPLNNVFVVTLQHGNTATS